jgi:DNA repair exonuclease SbcCD nuclease subunit
MKSLFVIVALLFTKTILLAIEPEINDKKDNFSFAFFTDIHLNKKNNGCFIAFEIAIQNAKRNKVDFIVTGGDNLDIDVLGDDAATANELFQKFKDVISKSDIPFYLTIGNHDRFWGVSKNDQLYNEGLFEKYLGKTYYSFDHKGWHFIILNTSNSVVDDEQKKWLETDLQSIDSKTPIIVSVHVPFLSVYYPTLKGKYTDTDTFSNFKEIWNMFEEKNLKLVLHGHMHLYEEIKVKNVQFITAGAVSASWWGGSYHGTEEGFLKVNVNGNDFNWEYIDYVWDVKK